VRALTNMVALLAGSLLPVTASAVVPGAALLAGAVPGQCTGRSRLRRPGLSFRSASRWLASGRRFGAQVTRGSTLTGLFAVVLTDVSPRDFRGTHYSMGWSFTPFCDVGACSVDVDSEANACAIGG